MTSNRGRVLEARPTALAIARGYYWPNADPDDVRQEAMLAVLEAEDSWNGSGSFANFAAIVIRRRLVDRIRASRRQLETLELDPERDPAPRTLEETVLARERLREALDAPLPPRERAVLLRAVQGYSYREIGAELDLSPSVVRWTAWRARSRLREAA